MDSFDTEYDIFGALLNMLIMTSRRIFFFEQDRKIKFSNTILRHKIS